jgi:hypothetical protein
MPDARQVKKPKKKVAKRKVHPGEQTEKLAADKKKKLAELDDFIEGVLEEAGEDFLDQFKQIEGQ